MLLSVSSSTQYLRQLSNYIKCRNTSPAVIIWCYLGLIATQHDMAVAHIS